MMENTRDEHAKLPGVCASTNTELNITVRSWNEVVRMRMRCLFHAALFVRGSKR